MHGLPKQTLGSTEILFRKFMAYDPFELQDTTGVLAGYHPARTFTQIQTADLFQRGAARFQSPAREAKAHSGESASCRIASVCNGAPGDGPRQSPKHVRL
jgi:hypothetical protein